MMPCKNCLVLAKCRNKDYYRLIISCKRFAEYIYKKPHDIVVYLYVNEFHYKDKETKSLRAKFISRRKIKSLRFLFGSARGFILTEISPKVLSSKQILRYKIFIPGDGYVDITRTAKRNEYREENKRK